ncbi:MAG TPA: alkaline phosphatase family protein [Ktedonobacteraceae bacterium]|nr:alkaline phosphatase family protein [Ktedonobacteraceae bacterium]
MRTVIFGADGLTFRVIHPLMEQGHMPNFKKLREQGCEAVLESKYPPLTPPAWTSLSTGLKPARHGVYDFWTYEEGIEQVGGRKAFVQTRRRGGKAIWNILSEYGKQVLVINVPITYPPEPVNGIMVSGYLTPSASVDFTYPASFKEELFRVVPDYEIDIHLRDIFSGKVENRVQKLVDGTLEMTEKRIALLKYLLTEKAWDFCYVVFVGPDRLQHSLWDEIIAPDPKTTEYYRMLDDALGFVLEQLKPEDSLFVVSDHGFQGISRSFDINEYLYSQGLLKLKSATGRKKASRFATLKHTLLRVGLLALAQRAKRILKSAGIIKKKKHGGVYRPVMDDIDWEHTLAYVPSMSGYGGGYADIFLNANLPAERVQQLCENLKRQVDPATGKPLIDAIYTTEVYGQGPFAPREQRLILLPTDGITFNMALGNKWLWNDVFTGRDRKKRRGSHQKDGVFYAYGAGIKQGFRAANAEVYDLVPTVLRSMGLPFPCEFDGKVIEDIFVEPQSSTQQAQGSEGGLARRKLKKLLEV